MPGALPGRWVYLSLGSNLGNRKKYIKEAIALLNKNPAFKLKHISSFYRTEPEEFKNQPNFLNVCLKARTTLFPGDLLKFLKKIEKELGRKKGRRFGPREIDIDILFYGNKCVSKKNLVIPHPRLERRLFVLKPLFEISPNLRHPVSGIAIRDLLRRSKNG
jgi:2-amino-4-hydroxy-6-hydroxymethyldihydropteridine diphosphokinase